MAGCEKPYNPPEVVTNPNLLVVEGNINTGGIDSTIINLSRTVSTNTAANPEAKATITIENAQGPVYTLSEIAKGTYAAPPLNLDNTKQYRLRIKTSNNKVYLSDLVDAKVVPPIDSIGFTIKSNGMQVYATTHDATNNTHYYKYTYQETWQFHTKFYTDFISNSTALLHRTPEQNIYYCYSGDKSTSTILNSTASLSQDLAYQFPVVFINSPSEKIQMRYSILISQQALTKDAYTYFDNLKKNTDELGGLFSTQPTQLIGNVHNIASPTEQVIGFVTAGTTQKKRVFIDNSQLPYNWGTGDAYGCAIDSAFYDGKGHEKFTPVSYLLVLPAQAFAVLALYAGNGYIYGYTFSTLPCTDCTTRGRIQKPDFWK